MQRACFKMHNAFPAKSIFFFALIFLLLELTLQFPDGIPGVPPVAHAEQTREEYRRIQKDIRAHKQKLESVKKQEQSVLEELRKMTSELHEIEVQLSAKRDKIKQLNS